MTEIAYGHPMYGKIPEEASCDQCGEHQATCRIWAPRRDGIHFTERGAAWLCECCYLKGSIEYAEKQALRLPELREKLEGACKK